MASENLAAQQEWYKPNSTELEPYRQAVGEIAEAMHEKGVGFLFGAGLSHESPSDLPLGAELARRLLRRAYKGVTDEDVLTADSEIDGLVGRLPFEAIMRAAFKQLPDQQTLLAFLKKQLRYGARCINDGHRALLRMYAAEQQRFPKRLFTTNFDLLLEDAFAGAKEGQLGAVTVVEAAYRERMKQAEQTGAIAVIHLHGALANEVNNVKDVWDPEHKLVRTDSPLLRAFHSELDQNIFVFVGCSLSDVDLRRTYSHVVEYLQGKGDEKRTYIVEPVKSSRELRVATALWDYRGATLLPVTAGGFLKDLADEFCNPDAAFQKRAVLDEMGGEAPKVEEGVRDLCNAFPDISPEQLYEYLYFRVKRKRV